jgi:hypothetical protein
MLGNVRFASIEKLFYSELWLHEVWKLDTLNNYFLKTIFYLKDL